MNKLSKEYNQALNSCKTAMSRMDKYSSAKISSFIRSSLQMHINTHAMMMSNLAVSLTFVEAKILTISDANLQKSEAKKAKMIRFNNDKEDLYACLFDSSHHT